MADLLFWHRWRPVLTVALSALALTAGLGARPPEVLAVPLPDGDEALGRARQAVEFVLGLSEEELRAMVPITSAGIRFTDCPNCDAGISDQGRFEWTPSEPKNISCAHCGERYPGNRLYPDDRYTEVPAPDGLHRLPYHQRASDGVGLYFEAHADYHARNYLKASALRLAQLYHLTGDEKYARPAAVILHRFAEVYPGYPFIFDFPFREVIFSPFDRNRIDGVVDYRVARWEWWAFRDISVSLLQAYDLLRVWPGLRDLEESRGEGRIREDLFRAQVEFVLGLEESFGNMSPRVWRDAIYAGRVLGEPDWVHEAVRRFERMLEERFLHDGHWMETSPSYAHQVLGSFRSMIAVAKGYSDPEGYRNPVDGRRFDELDLAAEAGGYVRAAAALRAPRFPDGRLIPLNDTWAGWPRRTVFLEPREVMEPVLLPGLGVAVLGGGEGPAQFHAYLNFTSGRHHKQRDALSIGMFAAGRELLPDLGYTHTRYRAWANSTMSHNTVVVDGRESEFDPDHSRNRLVEFLAEGRGFGLAAAESAAAYPELSRYRRTLVAIGEGAPEAYLLDLFEVHGGRQHDYLLHGNADEDSRLRVEGVELTDFDGTLIQAGATFERPSGEYDHPGPEAIYGFVEQLRRGEASGGRVLAQIRLEQSPGTGYSTTFLAHPGDQIFVGRSPSIRRADEDSARLNRYWMPFFAVRRVDNLEENIFIAAHEPRPEPTIRGLTARRAGGYLRVEVDRGPAGKDYFLMKDDSRSAAESLEPVPSRGRLMTDGSYALVRLNLEGKIYQANLSGGTYLSFGGFRLDGPGRWEGKAAVAGDRLMLEGGIEGDAFGALLVEFPDGTSRAFNLASLVRDEAGVTASVRERLGFEVAEGAIHLRSFPQRTIDGEQLRFRLSAGSAFYLE